MTASNPYRELLIPREACVDEEASVYHLVDDCLSFGTRIPAQSGYIVGDWNASVIEQYLANPIKFEGVHALKTQCLLDLRGRFTLGVEDASRNRRYFCGGQNQLTHVLCGGLATPYAEEWLLWNATTCVELIALSSVDDGRTDIMVSDIFTYINCLVTYLYGCGAI